MVCFREQADDDESLTGGPEASGEVGVNIGPSADKGDILRGTAVAESAGTASTSAQVKWLLGVP